MGGRVSGVSPGTGVRDRRLTAGAGAGIGGLSWDSAFSTQSPHATPRHGAISRSRETGMACSTRGGLPASHGGKGEGSRSAEGLTAGVFFPGWLVRYAGATYHLNPTIVST